MKTAYRVVEILYLLIAVVSFFEMIAQWPDYKVRSAVFAMFFALGIFMYFFRKKQRSKLK